MVQNNLGLWAPSGTVASAYDAWRGAYTGKFTPYRGVASSGAIPPGTIVTVPQTQSLYEWRHHPDESVWTTTTSTAEGTMNTENMLRWAQMAQGMANSSARLKQETYRRLIEQQWYIDEPVKAAPPKQQKPAKKLVPVPLSELLQGAGMCPVERALEFV